MHQVTEFDRLMSQLANGSEEAAMQVADKYTPYILRTVRRSFSPEMRQKMDSFDVAQTLWASVLLRPNDLLRFKSPEDFIAYLAEATRRKVIEKKRALLTKKRNINREVQLSSGEDSSLDEGRNDKAMFSREPTPSTLASLRERWQSTLSGASERDRKIVELRLSRHTFDEISSLLSIHEQTARRAVERLLEQFSQ
jgi:RNA polymerase sigma factor (sigma-70 family)